MKRVMLTRPIRSQVAYVKHEKKELGNSTPLPTTPPYKGCREGGFTQAAKQEQKKTVEEILALTNLLTATERKELLARLALTAQTLPMEQARDVDMWAQAVYEALSAATGGEGGGMAGPLALKRLLAVSAAWAPVSNFMKSSRMDTLTVLERQSVYTMLAKLVVENARTVARHVGLPLTGKLVANCSSNIVGIFAQSFPGYLESGLALMVAKRLTGH